MRAVRLLLPACLSLLGASALAGATKEAPYPHAAPFVEDFAASGLFSYGAGSGHAWAIDDDTLRVWRKDGTLVHEGPLPMKHPFAEHLAPHGQSAIVWLERKKGLLEVSAFDLTSGTLHSASLDENTWAAGLSADRLVGVAWRNGAFEVGHEAADGSLHLVRVKDGTVTGERHLPTSERMHTWNGSDGFIAATAHPDGYLPDAAALAQGLAHGLVEAVGSGRVTRARLLMRIQRTPPSRRASMSARSGGPAGCR